MADFKRLLGIFFLFSGADSAVAVADSSSVLFLLLLFGIWTKGVAVVSSTRLDYMEDSYSVTIFDCE